MASVLQVATIKDQGGNANAIEIANSSANVTINNLAAGTIGSAVTIGTQDYFLAKMDGDQTLSDNTWSEVEFDLDVHDPNSWFNTSTKKFQPTKAGKYYVYAITMINSGGNGNIYLNQLSVSKNTTTGTNSTQSAYDHFDFRNERISDNTLKAINIIDMNGSSDYLHVRAHCYAGTSSTIESAYTYFGGFRIGA